MKKHLALLLIISSLALNATPCFAGSKTATIRISCTILPSLELSTSAKQDLAIPTELALMSNNSQVYVHSNLGNDYRMVESLFTNAGKPVKLYSVTAL